MKCHLLTLSCLKYSIGSPKTCGNHIVEYFFHCIFCNYSVLLILILILIFFFPCFVVSITYNYWPLCLMDGCIFMSYMPITWLLWSVLYDAVIPQACFIKLCRTQSRLTTGDHAPLVIAGCHLLVTILHGQTFPSLMKPKLLYMQDADSRA